VRPLPAFAALVLGALAVASAAAPAGARDATDDLLLRYRSVQGRRDDAGYAEQRAALEALADLDTDDARKTLRGLLPDARADRRGHAILLEAIVKRGGPEEMDLALREVDRAGDPALQGALARVLGRALRPEARAHLRSVVLLRSPPPVQVQAARALASMDDPDAADALLALAGATEDPVVRAEAIVGIGDLADPRAAPILSAFARADDARVREAALRTLGRLGTERSLPALVLALEDPSPRVVEAAADGLAALETDAAFGPLIDRLAKAGADDLRLVDSLTRALGRLSGLALGDDADLWRAWWEQASQKPRPERERRAPTTVAGPRYFGFPVRSSRVVFVLDVSRSMGWNGRLERAQDELRRAISHLPARTRFDIVTFSDVSEGWRDKLVAATPETVRKALAFVDRQKPISGTNIFDALRRAFAVEEADTIFFLSDGSPSTGALVDPDAILAEVREWNRWRRVRIHAIALVQGEPPSEFAATERREPAVAFLRRLAADHEGDFRSFE
jgi:HEAT repeat protein